MPRIRTLKPEIVEDEKVGPLSDAAFRLFTAMIVLADDAGNVRADVRWLKSQIWWAHENPPNVLQALVQLARSRLIEAYGVRGGTYAHLVGWSKHQRIDNAGKGRLLPSSADTDASPISLDIHSSDIASLPADRDPVSRAVSDLESPTCQQVRPPPLVSAEIRGEIPRVAAVRGSDQDQDQDQDQDPDLGPARRRARSKGQGKPPPKPGKRLIPEDWQPVDGLGTVQQNHLSEFRDHHRSKGNLFVDIEAAWRNWQRRIPEFKRGRFPSGTQENRLEPLIERVRMHEAEEKAQR